MGSETLGKPLVEVSLSRASLNPGDPLTVRVRGAFPDEYDQLQLTIVKAGVLNPSFAISTGAEIDHATCAEASISVKTDSLGPGFYEVALVRLQSAQLETSSHVDYVGGRDFERQFLEVGASEVVPRSSDMIRDSVIRLEQELQRQFNAPVDLAEAPQEAEEFWALVFLKDILLGTRMRFSNFEVLPTGSGLDRDDELRFVNRFLDERTRAGFGFEVDDESRARKRQETPAAVLHFPSLRAPNSESVLNFCMERAQVLLLALALSRDAGGRVFDVVIASKTGKGAERFSVTRPYRGNLLTGGLSGESADQIALYLDALDASAFDRFLVGLYREARRESNPDFEYVRFWQILELMADSMNFDESAFLLDDDGQPITRNGKPVRLKGSVQNVCALLQAESIGKSAENWRTVNIWFAFRSAVAHHGSVRRYHMLWRDARREWARKGLEEVERDGGHDTFLWKLKEDVKLILMKRLARVAVHEEEPLGG